MIIWNCVEEMLEKDGVCVTDFSGISMMPMLRQAEDRIMLVRPQFPLEVGTVVLFRRGNQRVLHRIVAIRGDTYQIRGDNCVTSDWARREQIIGVLAGYWHGEEYHDCLSGMECRAFGIRANRTLPLRYCRAKLAGVFFKWRAFCSEKRTR